MPIKRAERKRYPSTGTCSVGSFDSFVPRAGASAAVRAATTTSGAAEERHGQDAHSFGGTVRLAAAHLDHTPENDASVVALCQRCHLQHDRPHHIAERRKTWLAERAGRGVQLCLALVVPAFRRLTGTQLDLFSAANDDLLKLRQFGERLAQKVAAHVGVYTSSSEHQSDLLRRLRDSRALTPPGVGLPLSAMIFAGEVEQSAAASVRLSASDPLVYAAIMPTGLDAAWYLIEPKWPAIKAKIEAEVRRAIEVQLEEQRMCGRALEAYKGATGKEARRRKPVHWQTASKPAIRVCRAGSPCRDGDVRVFAILAANH